MHATGDFGESDSCLVRAGWQWRQWRHGGRRVAAVIVVVVAVVAVPVDCAEEIVTSSSLWTGARLRTLHSSVESRPWIVRNLISCIVASWFAFEDDTYERFDGVN